VNDEPSVAPPLLISYPAFGDAGLAGQGSNPSSVGYSVGLVHLDGGASVSFGVYDTDVGEGVPWDDDGGVLTDGTVRAWSIDVGVATSTHRITLTFATPVHGLRLAVTDLDFISESVGVTAFPVDVGGSAIAVTDHSLSAPQALPSLAQGVPHAGNDAYLVDQTKVTALGAGRYGVLVSGGVSNSTGSVLFAWDDQQPVQRVEIEYAGSNTGVWITAPVFNDACMP
jgi:hypothetical protein